MVVEADDIGSRWPALNLKLVLNQGQPKLDIAVTFKGLGNDQLHTLQEDARVRDRHPHLFRALQVPPPLT